jgi:hypothetical protein
MRFCCVERDGEEHGLKHMTKDSPELQSYRVKLEKDQKDAENI